MKNQRKSYVSYFVLFCALMLTTLSAAQAKTFTVNFNGDLKDTNPGDGICGAAYGTCTLRAAIEEANAYPGADTIEFDASFHAPNPPSTITLGLKQLVINTSIAIKGPGARQLTIDGAQKDRVMRIVSLPGSANTVAVSGLTIQNGLAGAESVVGGGGGIYVDHTVLTLKAVTVRNNKAGYTSPGQPGNGKGGGIFSIASQVTITDSTLNGNSAGLHGGGIYSGGGYGLSIYNSTLSGNSAMGGGGGIYQTDNGVIRNTTIVGNQGWQNAGGGVWFNNADPVNGYNQVGNTIIAGNGAAVSWDITGKFDSLGNNLVGTRGGSSGYVASDLPNGTSPKLGSLKNNGGQTDTFKPLDGSPAIDAGSDCIAFGETCASRTPEYDQRGFGFARKYGSSVDIGAVEYAPIVVGPVIIRGRLFKANGRGAEPAIITLTAPDGTVRSVETDSKGRYSFDGVETGKAYVLKVENQSADEAYEPQTVILTEARDDVNFIPVGNQTETEIPQS